MTVPTHGESFAKLMEHIRYAQEEAATLAHLARANDQRALADGWISVSELFKRVGFQVTQLAMRKLQ